jgi:hypothetical protein
LSERARAERAGETIDVKNGERTGNSREKREIWLISFKKKKKTHLMIISFRAILVLHLTQICARE